MELGGETGQSAVPAELMRELSLRQKWDGAPRTLGREMNVGAMNLQALYCLNWTVPYSPGEHTAVCPQSEV